jgi:cytochrome c biogenesis protein
MGSVSFDGLERWNKIQISQTPGKFVALAGVVLALVGLLGSLFVRSRRVWVRVRRVAGDAGERTVVEIGGLDRAGGADPERGAAELADIMEALGAPTERDEEKV